LAGYKLVLKLLVKNLIAKNSVKGMRSGSQKIS